MNHILACSLFDLRWHHHCMHNLRTRILQIFTVVRICRFVAREKCKHRQTLCSIFFFSICCNSIDIKRMYQCMTIFACTTGCCILHSPHKTIDMDVHNVTFMMINWSYVCRMSISRLRMHIGKVLQYKFQILFTQQKKRRKSGTDGEVTEKKNFNFRLANFLSNQWAVKCIKKRDWGFMLSLSGNNTQ